MGPATAMPYAETSSDVPYRGSNETGGHRETGGLLSRRTSSATEEKSKSMIEAKKKLEEDIRAAEHELKVELPKEIQRAREWGDLRENAEYKAAKERQAFLQARIAQLQGRLAGLSMMNLDSIPKDKVGLGSTVHVRDEDTGEENTYDIVTSEESDPDKGRISPSSPIGRCLLNKKVGEVAEVRVPKGTRYVEILKLATIHDAR